VSEILDALEFDMQSHKHGGGIPPPVMSTQASVGSPDNRKSSEEEEIKWLSAVRALIARRTGAGVVPGDLSGNQASKPAAGGGEAGQGGATSSSGLRHKVRNLSISGPSGGPISDG
jgi:hypothetical protein